MVVLAEPAAPPSITGLVCGMSMLMRKERRVVSIVGTTIDENSAEPSPMVDTCV